MLKKIAVILALPLFLNACAAPVLLVGAGAGAGYVAVQERGAKAFFSDTKVKTHIKDKLVQMKYGYLTDIGVNVIKGDVLLTGVVKNEDEKQKIEQTAENTEGVKAVYNEIMVAPEYTGGEYARDSWISTQLKTRMLTAKDVYSVNYMIDVVKGHVYLYGLASNQAELERVVYLARTTKNVDTVHNYIRIIPKKDVKVEDATESDMP